MRLTLFVFACFSINVLCGQNLDLANKLFNNGIYARAIPIYEQSLAKKRTPSVLGKLANCHRLLSQSEKAATYFRDLMTEKKVNPKEYFNFGEVLMMLGKYDSAKMYFKLYMEAAPEDENGKRMYENCDNARNIKPLFKDVKVEAYAFNTDADENGVSFFDGKLIFASDRPRNYKLLKEKNHATGREYIDLYFADSIKSDTGTFGEPKFFSTQISTLNTNTGNASFTADRKTVYFCQNTQETSRKGTFTLQIYEAHTSNDGRTWSDIKVLPFCQIEQNYFYPSISPDGNKLFYVAERGDGQGGLDIYMSRKSAKGWSRPENLGDKINTAQNELSPFIAPDGSLYFASKGHIGYGGYDIFVSTYDGHFDTWSDPVNLGAPFNSCLDDLSFAFGDLEGKKGAFATNRANNGDDIFFFEIGSTDSLALAAMAQKAKETVEKAEKEHENTEKQALKTASTPKTQSTAEILRGDIASGKMRENKRYVMPTKAFANDSTLIMQKEFEAELDDFSVFLQENDKTYIEIGVHSPLEKSIDDTEYMKKMRLNTQQQAEVIKTYLIEKGIKEKRIMAKGYGSMRTKGENAPESSENRRVEIKIVKF